MGSKNGKSTGLWIPENLKNDKKLDWTNKALLSEIYSLCKLADGCFASDNHFGKLLGLGRSSVNKRVNWLKDQGYINAVNHYKENLIIGRTITKGSSQEKHTLVPKRGRGSSQSIQGVVPKRGRGSSQSIQGVVPKRGRGSSVENTTNTTTNTDIIIQETIQDTGAVLKSDVSMNQLLTNRFEELVFDLVNKSSLGEEIFNYTQPGNLAMFRDAVNEEEYKLVYPLLINIIDVEKKLYGK